MKTYNIDVNGNSRAIPATSARVAINKMLRSVIGTRTADKMLPLFITISRGATKRKAVKRKAV